MNNQVRKMLCNYSNVYQPVVPMNFWLTCRHSFQVVFVTWVHISLSLFPDSYSLPAPVFLSRTEKTEQQNHATKVSVCQLLEKISIIWRHTRPTVVTLGVCCACLASQVLCACRRNNYCLYSILTPKLLKSALLPGYA